MSGSPEEAPKPMDLRVELLAASMQLGNVNDAETERRAHEESLYQYLQDHPGLVQQMPTTEAAQAMSIYCRWSEAELYGFDSPYDDGWIKITEDATRYEPHSINVDPLEVPSGTIADLRVS